MKVVAIRMWEFTGPEGRFTHTRKLVGVFTGFFFTSEDLAKKFVQDHPGDFSGVELEYIPVGIVSPESYEETW